MMSAKIDNQTRRSVYKRDGWRCALCDSTNGLQIHHIIPRGKGGSSEQRNLITLCWRCHAAAHGTRLPEHPDYLTPDYIAQACVEYISDLYAENGEVWVPF